MNNATNLHGLPTSISSAITNKNNCIDNIFADAWKKLRLNVHIKNSQFIKRSGIDISEAVFLLLLWKWINVSSIAMFARKSLCVFSDAKKDVMYDLLKREDTNWRKLNLKAAKEIIIQNDICKSNVKAFVLDDSIKARKGKKMEGISSHFDHVSGRHVMGQQVLTLGLATEKTFLPLDSQIFISKVKATGLVAPYKDGRSVVAKRYDEAREQSKPEMAEHMMKRAINEGIKADYLIADAWFGTKTMLRTAVKIDVCAILRMKKNTMKYRANITGKKIEYLNAKDLYSRVVKGEWRKVNGLPWKTVTLEVDLNIEPDNVKHERWITVKLLFVRALTSKGEADVGKKDWALFLTTEPNLSTVKILEVYALRWGIEVYFKEAKQHLGFLKEQTVRFSSHTASIHLCAIRYLILAKNKLDGENGIGEIREDIQDQLNSMGVAQHIWSIFRVIINNTLDKLKKTLNSSVNIFIDLIDTAVAEFFIRSLQLDVLTLEQEYYESPF